MNGPPLLPAGLAHAARQHARHAGRWLCLCPCPRHGSRRLSPQKRWRCRSSQACRPQAAAPGRRTCRAARFLRAPYDLIDSRPLAKKPLHKISFVLYGRSRRGDRCGRKVGCPALPLRRGMQLPCMPLQRGNIPAKGRDRPGFVGKMTSAFFDFRGKWGRLKTLGRIVKTLIR